MEGNGPGPYVALETSDVEGIGDHPTCCEAQGDGAAIVLGERESRLHGEGRQVSRDPKREVREMRNADTILGIMHERGTPQREETLESRVLRKGAPRYAALNP